MSLKIKIIEKHKQPDGEKVEKSKHWSLTWLLDLERQSLNPAAERWLDEDPNRSDDAAVASHANDL